MASKVWIRAAKVKRNTLKKNQEAIKMFPTEVCINWLHILIKMKKKKIKKNWQLPSKSLNSGQAENGHGCSYSASMEAKYCHLYWCLVYSLNCVLEGVMDILCVPDGKSYQSGEFLRPYVQTNP